MPTFALTPDVNLELEEPVARRLYLRMHEHFDGRDLWATDALSLDDNHPLWERHSGRTGHTGPEWSSGDETLAEAFYALLSGKGKLFFDLLLEAPGQQLTVDDLIAASGGAFTSSLSIAGAINGLRKAHKASGRRNPFYWWAGTPSRYAVKCSVADVFNAARAKIAS
ncbi:MAG: DUF6416 domain-containing protein [Microthrixaceae bacterium]